MLFFTHYRDDRHQDHRVLSDLAWNTFRNHLILEYEILKYDGDLGRPNVFVPLLRANRRPKDRITHEAFQNAVDQALVYEAIHSQPCIASAESSAPRTPVSPRRSIAGNLSLTLFDGLIVAQFVEVLQAAGTHSK